MQIFNRVTIIALLVAYGFGVISGVRIHMGVVALDEKAANIQREAEAIAAAQEAADIIGEATDETAAVIKQRTELNNVISKYAKEEEKRKSMVAVTTTCPAVTCIDGLFIETWNDIATKTSKPNGGVR